MTTEQKWRLRVQGWRGSGLTATAYCDGKDFSSSGLRYWASRLRRQSNGKDVRLARVVRTGDELDTPIVVEVGGARVGVRRGFDREALKALLDVLRTADEGQ